jgi:hypothetical protein
MGKYSDRPYAVGKGKPPVHTQFGKDRPGNTGGRPKGTRNADTVVTKALGVRFGVTENGKDRTMSKLEAAVTQLVNKAAGGDLKAIALVLRLNREIEARAQPYGETQPLSDADRTVLEQFAAQVRARKEKGDAQG